MGKVSLTKEFSWDMAHLLAGHEGLCQNLHGHTYRMQIEVARKSSKVIEEDINSMGMVIDFKDLKKLVRSEIVDPFDHAFMYWAGSPEPLEHEIADILKRNGRKIATVDYRPTVEEMAMNIFNKLNQILVRNELELLGVKIWETPTSFADVRKER